MVKHTYRRIVWVCLTIKGLSRFGFSFFQIKMKNGKQISSFNFNVHLFWKSKYHLVLCFMSQLQYRNKNQNFISNFVFQFIKKAKWHFGYMGFGCLFVVTLDGYRKNRTFRGGFVIPDLNKLNFVSFILSFKPRLFLLLYIYRSYCFKLIMK